MIYECYNPVATLQRNDKVGSVRPPCNTAPNCETRLCDPFSPIVSMCAPFGLILLGHHACSGCLSL